MGLIGNLQDKLSGHKDPAVNASYNNQGANTYQTQSTTTGGLPGHDSSHPTHGTTTTSHNPLSSNAPHGNSGITGGSHPLVSGGNNTNTYNEPGYQQSGPGLTGASHHSGGLNDNSYAHNNTQGGIVPGSHPAANNPSAIPTAGGQRVGGIDDGYGHSSSHAGVHETAGDKLKNALPGQQGNAHDAYGNPINPSTTGAHTMSSHSSHPTGSHNTAYNNQPGYSSNQPLSHDSQFNDRHAGTGAGVVGGAGLASSGHHDTHNIHNTHNVGEDNRGMMDKAKDALSSKRSNQPDDPITGTNYDQKTRDQYTGDQYNTHNIHNTTTGYGTQHQTTGTHGLASHQQHGSGVNSSYNTHNTAVAGEDNRGMMDKAKDALSSKRSNQPDDPITGTNYDQKDRREYTEGHHGTHNQTAGVAAGGLASHQQYGSNTHDNYNTHGTHSSHNTHGTHNTHNTGVVHEDNRGMMDKAKDALSSKRSNQPDDPITGTNYDQKDRREYTEGTHGTGYTGSSHDNRSHNTHQQAGVAGITSGLGQTHIGSNTHSSGSSHIGRTAEWKDGYETGYQEALRSLNSGSHTGAHSGSHVGSTGAYSSTTGAGYADHNKPTMGEKMNPKTDADRDGKVGFMD